MHLKYDDTGAAQKYFQHSLNASQLKSLPTLGAMVTSQERTLLPPSKRMGFRTPGSFRAYELGHTGVRIGTREFN